MIDRVRRVIRKHGFIGTFRRALVALSRTISARLEAGALRWRNVRGGGPVTGDADAIVSLTTYGPRVRLVFLTIESIARGTIRPKRLILWLDDPGTVADPPPELRRLVRRGLEVLLTEDIGSHKKYFPTLDAAISTGVSRLITVDDDMLYPKWWLERLMAAAAEDPSAIVAYRARRVLLTDQGFAPWDDWPLCDSATASPLNFAIGEAGVGYPQAVLQALRERGRGFLATAPRVDDIWLHSTAVSIGVPTRQVTSRALHPLVVPGSQVVALAHSNIDGGGNDTALQANYRDESLVLLHAAGASEESE